VRVARIASVPAGFFCLLWAAPIHAACSGSGTSWSCPAGSTTSDVNSAISTASDGATITFANGSYTWSSTIPFSLSKGVTLICANGATCSVSSSGTVFAFPTGSSAKLYRISGFAFSTSGGFGPVWTCPSGGCVGTISQFRIDHNSFTGPGASYFIVTGENASRQYIYGVVDHNTFTSSGSIEAMYNLGGHDSSPPANPQGTANNMFFEDNTLTVTTMTDAGLGATDGWGAGSALVIRHNTFTNALVTAHAQETGSAGDSGSGGFQNWEIYNNHVIATSGSTYPDGYRLIHHQGSHLEMFFNNTFTPQSEPLNGSALSITANYIDTTCNSYPCSLAPGRDPATNALYPVYSWNNRDTDNGNNVSGVAEASTTYFAPNRDYFTEAIPFTGATGVGFGTLANRPTTCSTGGTQAGDAGHGGVGYFATDVGLQGTLYHCTATNTWAVEYTPYTYPHPLVTGGVSSDPPPLPPTSLTLTVR